MGRDHTHTSYGHQETARDAGGSHKSDVKALMVRDLQSWGHLADREAKVAGGEGRGPISTGEGGKTSS